MRALGMAVISSLVVGCGYGAKIPPIGTKRYKQGKLPSPAQLPVLTKTGAEVKQLVDNRSQVLCDQGAPDGTPKLSTDVLLRLKGDLGTLWREPTSIDAQQWLAKGVVSLVAALTGGQKMNSYGMVCDDRVAAINVNGKWYGPFDIVYATPNKIFELGEQLGTSSSPKREWHLAAWSANRRRLLHFSLTNVVGDVIQLHFTDFSKYVPAAGVTFHAKLGSSVSSLEAVVLKSDNKNGWLIKGLFGGSIWPGDYMAETIGVLKVK